MKKNLILAVAAVLAVGQFAQAAPTDKGGKPEGVKGREVRDDLKKAGESAVRGADAKSPTVAQLRKAGLADKLGTSPNVEADLAAVAKKFPEAVADMLKNQGNAELLRLNQARLETLILLKDMKSGVTKDAFAKLTEDGKIMSAVETLATEAGAEAAGWGNKDLRDNLTTLLEEMNSKLRGGKATEADIVASFKSAQATLRKSPQEGGKGVEVKIEDINKFCKKA